MITPLPTSRRLGGVAHAWRSKSLRDIMVATGFDPDAAGSEWVLVVTDTHAYHDERTSDADRRILWEIEHLSRQENAPSHIVHIGDVLGNYVLWGWPPLVERGLFEIGMATRLLAPLASLAPMSMSLGNHDVHTGEEPTGAFMLANCPQIDAINTTVEVGGVRFCTLTFRQDASMPPEALAAYLSALEGLAEGQEVVFATHQPGGGRARDFAGVRDMFENFPAGVQNLIWQISGHQHFTNNTSTLALPNGNTVVQWLVGAGNSNDVLHFTDGEAPAMAAIACRGGKVVQRYAWSGIYRMWFAQSQPSRANPSPLAGQFDGVANETVLSTWTLGVSDFTGRWNNSQSLTTWRDVGTWLAHVILLEANFPLPAGSTKFFCIGNLANPVKYSADGATWVIGSNVSFESAAFISEIPVALRDESTIHIRIEGNSSVFLSALGFLQ